MKKTAVELSPRLQVIADWVPKGSLFADIGTDHGYLPLYLLQKGKLSGVIASDVKEGPLNAARNTALRYGATMDFRLGNGLERIHPCEVDCLAIAGMGGVTISQILEQWQHFFPEARDWNGSYLLQPMSTQKELRAWLNAHDFFIEQERTISEGNILYNAMYVRKGKDVPYTEAELLVGRQRREYPDEQREALFQETLEKLDKILEKLGSGEHLDQRKLDLNQQKKLLIEMRKEWLEWQQ